MMRPPFLFFWFTLSAFFGWACSGAHEKPKDRNGAVGGPARKLALVLDVPAMVGASIDELRRQLGPAGAVPNQLADPAALAHVRNADAYDSAAAFRRRGVTVVATFDTRTRQVSDLLVLGKNEQTVIQQANLDVDSPDYLLLTVFDAHNTSRFLGLRVVSKSLAK